MGKEFRESLSHAEFSTRAVLFQVNPLTLKNPSTMLCALHTSHPSVSTCWSMLHRRRKGAKARTCSLAISQSVGKNQVPTNTATNWAATKAAAAPLAPK